MSLLLTGLKKVKTNIDSGTPNIMQEVAALALANMQHIEQVREEYRQKRSVLMNAFARVGLPPAPGDATFYLWQRGKPGGSGWEFVAQLLELGIVVTPGGAIGETVAGKNPAEDFVRFALVPPLADVEYAAECIEKGFA